MIVNRKTQKDEEEAGAFRTSIGGQALIEGILMRGPQKQTIAVKTKNGIVIKTEDLVLTKDKHKFAGWPFIRGVVNFGTSMTAGVKSLMYSANLAIDDEDSTSETEAKEGWLEKKLGSEKAEKAVVMISVIFGIGMSIGLFMLLPTFIAGFAARFTTNSILKNLVEGLIRIVIFILYIGLSSLLKDMYRVWQYHGAEHKTIFCYEKRMPLTVENCRVQPRCHPRCGTSFMFIVMIVSILLFSVFSWHNIFIRILTRLAMLPIVVAVSYEIIKMAGRYDNIVTRIVSAPGKALQRLTTREPDDEMLEVAIAAVTPVIPDVQGEDIW